MRRTLKNIGIADIRSSHTSSRGLPTPRAEPQTLLEREPLWLPGCQRSHNAATCSKCPLWVPGAALQREVILWRHSTMKLPKVGGP